MADVGTAGQRIRGLLETATECVEIIAPFIKVEPLRSLLEVARDDIHVRCVTRWLPRDVAAGVSDLEVFDILEGRGNSELVLVDRLHAKLYVADDQCLVGSANVTRSGLGEAEQSNVEVLVKSSVSNEGIRDMLDEIKVLARPASHSMLEATRRLANSLAASPISGESADWHPTSRRPNLAYGFYREPPDEKRIAADLLLLNDVAEANLPAGLTKEEFDREIQSLLATIPIAQGILAATKDEMLTFADAHSYLSKKESESFTVHDLWLSFVKWMAHFHADKVMEQEVAEVALRRAQVLNISPRNKAARYY